MYRRFLVAAMAIAGHHPAGAQPLPRVAGPDTVHFTSGTLELRGLVWRPDTPGTHPAVLFDHGSGKETYEREMAAIGPFYASHGYILFWPYRRGQGLSAGSGAYIVDELDKAATQGGAAARSQLMARLLSTEQLDDQLAALAFLKTMPGVDSTRIATEGNSFGGIVAVFLAARGAGLRAVVASAPAAQSWAESPELQSVLLEAVRNAKVPIWFMQAENDYDLTPTKAMAEAMERAGKPYRRQIYPPYGATVAEGHSFGYFGSQVWGADVLRYLESAMGKQ